MNSVLKCCVGYISFYNLLIPSTCRKYGPIFYNVTLKNYSNVTHYRFRKNHYAKQVYDAFLILDFESTCLTGYNTIKQHEIIEFPCLWVNASTLKIENVFHKYIKPVVHPVLDTFCTHLTGITNDMVENERHFKDVFDEFVLWYQDLKHIKKANHTIFITDGRWDLEYMLPEQCRLSKIEMPSFMKNWLDVRNEFSSVMGLYPKTLKDMVLLLDIKKKGRYHSGIDDSKYIYEIVCALAKRGHVFY